MANYRKITLNFLFFRSTPAQWAQITKKIHYKNFILRAWKVTKKFHFELWKSSIFSKCDLQVTKNFIFETWKSQKFYFHALKLAKIEIRAFWKVEFLGHLGPLCPGALCILVCYVLFLLFKSFH